MTQRNHRDAANHDVYLEPKGKHECLSAITKKMLKNERDNCALGIVR